MHPTRQFIVLCLGVGLALAPTIARAALPHLASWKQVLNDGRYVLVMVSPLPVDEDAGHPGFDAEVIRNIRAMYPQSGLYPNDGTVTPLWTVPYHDWTHDVFIGPRGQHLIIAADDWNTWSSTAGHVVTFFSNGTELKSYSITDLFSSFDLSLPGVARLNCTGVSFDANTLTFTSHTHQGHTLVFDVTNGQLVRHTSSLPKYLGLAIAGLAIAAVILSLRMHRKRKAP